MEIASGAAANEHDLLRRARWGDEQAFNQLYRHHAAAVYTLALRLTGNVATAQDLTQDAFLKMVRFIGGLKQDRPLRPWLKRVVANAAIDVYRQQKHYSTDFAEHAWRDGDAAHDERLDAEAALRRLPPLVRTVVWLNQVEGWTHEELGRRFERSESWSKSTVSRALMRLRQELEGEHES